MREGLRVGKGVRGKPQKASGSCKRHIGGSMIHKTRQHDRQEA